jgi:Domain of unknown function (DUF5679)
MTFKLLVRTMNLPVIDHLFKRRSIQVARPVRENTGYSDPNDIDNFPGYCLKCKRYVLAHAGRRVVMLNSREATTGECPDCGTKIYQLSTKSVILDDFQEFRMSEIKEETRKLRLKYNRLKREGEWLKDPIIQATLKWANFFEE